MGHQGYFLIADITGYTAFMTGSELDHAQDILRSLFGVLIDNIKPPLMISNFQGDAILSYVPDGSFIQGQTLLEIIEGIYCEFVRMREKLSGTTACDCCNACANIGSLDLKMFVHYGNYRLQSLHDKTELSSPDVIITHRMMKNSVNEKTGVRAYALITEAALDALQLGESREQMIPHSESYEHIGAVPMRVYDLIPVWKRWHEQQEVYVQTDSAWDTLEESIPAPPMLIWDYLTEPHHRSRWMGIDHVDMQGLESGRTGVGTVMHCVSGRLDMAHTIVDWHPPAYITEDIPVRFLGSLRQTLELAPVEGGTRLSYRIAPAGVPNPAAAPLWKLVCRASRNQRRKRAALLRQIIEKDLAAGEIVVPDLQKIPIGPTAAA